MLCKFTLIDPLHSAIILMPYNRHSKRQADGNWLTICLFDRTTKVEIFILLRNYAVNNGRLAYMTYCEQYWYETKTKDNPPFLK